MAQKDGGAPKAGPKRLHSARVRQITPPAQAKDPARSAKRLTIAAGILLALTVVLALVFRSLVLLALGALVAVLPFWLGVSYRQEAQRRQDQAEKAAQKADRKKKR